MALRTAPGRDGGVQAPQLAKYIGLFKSRWLSLMLCVLAGVGAAFYDISRTPTTYVASAQLFVTASEVRDASGLFSGNQFAESRVQTYVSVVTSPAILGPVRSDLGLSLSDRQLTQRISADAPLNKTLVNIHVIDGSPTRAAQIANSVAAQFIIEVKAIETEKAATSTAVASSVLKLTITHPALVPVSPVAPQKKLILLTGFFGGLFVGLLIVVVRQWANNRLRSPIDFEAITTLPLLGVIPVDRHAKSEPNAFQRSTSPRSEAFRVLRTNLQFVDVDAPPKVIAITSPVGLEGKTTVALNLAVSLCEIGQSVCLVETDLRRPVLAQRLGLDSEPGLTSLLNASAELDEAIQYSHRGLSVVTSGWLPPNPSEFLASKQLRAIVAGLAERFDCVVLDACSLLAVADGAEVVSLADATLLVARAGETTRENFRRSLSAIRLVEGSIAGVVLNRSSDTPRTVRARKHGGSQAPPHDDVDATSTAVTALARAADASSARKTTSRGRRRAHNSASVRAAGPSAGESRRVERDLTGEELRAPGDPWLLGG